jgi:hypothetical protein
MGIAAGLRDVLVNFEEQLWNPQLETLGLGRNQIEEQNLEELEKSLVQVDQLLATDDRLGRVHFRMGPDLIPLVTTPSEGQLSTNGSLTLLRRKRLILDRIKSLAGDERVESIRALVEKVTDEEAKQRLLAELDKHETAARDLEVQEQQVQRVEAKTEEELGLEIAKGRFDLFERRSRILRGFLERESVATIIGALLLLVLVTVMIVAMFVNRETSDVITNSFLIILGYFFGQKAGRAEGT